MELHQLHELTFVSVTGRRPWVTFRFPPGTRKEVFRNPRYESCKLKADLRDPLARNAFADMLVSHLSANRPWPAGQEIFSVPQVPLAYAVLYYELISILRSQHF